MNKRFAVVDIETTGGLFKRDKITEVAIVITDGRQIIDEYATLVNPGRSIPPFITKITGITDEMVSGAPPFYEVAREIVLRTEGHIFVAHNVRFDYGFLREEFASLGFAFNRKRMCTVQLSRKMLGLRSHSLESLIKHYNIPVDKRHRALDDARATAVVLHNILELEASTSAVNHQINRGVRESLLPQNITIEDLHKIPESTGVYYFKDASGNIVYIGKSKNIQKRVMQHFAKTTRKAERLQQRVHSVDFEVTGSELLAQIFEAQEIKKHLPELNRAQRTANFNTYLQTSVNALGYRRFDLVKNFDSWDGILDSFSSPKSGKFALSSIIEEFDLCPLYTGLEIGMGPCSRHQFEQCLGACIHEESAEDYNVRANAAMLAINNRFLEDFVILDAGRTNDEKSVIVVKNGSYFGHGHFSADLDNVHSSTALVEGIKTGTFYPELNTFIKQARAKHPDLIILPFSEI
jgi:DNA polymerase-3 subunit epsilon